MTVSSELIEKKYRRVEGIRKRSWGSAKFANSPTSQKLLKFFKEKFVPSVAPIGLTKCLPFVSSKIEGPGISIGHSSPTRSFKTALSHEIINIFSNDFYLDLQSDFTMNSLKRYEKQLKQGRGLILNDGVLLSASKQKRYKDRLFGGLGELISDGSYTYQDYNTKFILEGNVRLLMNVSSESYTKFKDRLFALTFYERLLMVHHVLPKSEMERWIVKEQETRDMQFTPKITLEDIETEIKYIPPHFLKLIKLQAREISYLTLRSYIGCQDLIKGLVRAHASLNNRNRVCSDDFALVSLIKTYLIDPFNPHEGRIVKLRAEGFSYREIEKMIGKKNYLHQIQRIVRKAQLRGILPLQTKND